MTDQSFLAAIDIGSNSFHVVLARELDGSIQILSKQKQRVKLAEGLNEQLILSDEAINRGLATLQQFSELLGQVAPNRLRIVATYTLRAAKNSAVFLRKARQFLPRNIEVISGQEEARLIYQGVAHHTYSEGQRLVIDIGGGSTEFIIGSGFNPLLLSSRNMGCVSYSKRFFKDGVITEKRFVQARLAAEQELEPVVKAYRKLGWQTAIGTSGSFKAIRDVLHELGLCEHDVSLSQLQQLQAQLIQLGRLDAINFKCVTAERAQVLCGGLAILIAAYEMLAITNMQFCDAALREGVLYELSQSMQQADDIRQRTLSSLQQRFAIEPVYAQAVSQTVEQLYQQLLGHWPIEHGDGPWLLSCCANLLEVGLTINSSGFHKHSGYIIANAMLPGFNQEQQRLLALLLSCQRKRLKVEFIPEFSLYSAELVAGWIAIIRLAVMLNQKRVIDAIPDVQLSATATSVTLTFDRTWLTSQPLLHADLLAEKTQLKKLGWQLLITQRDA